MLTLILRGYGYIGYTQIGRVAYPREEDSPRIVCVGVGIINSAEVWLQTDVNKADPGGCVGMSE